MKILLETHGIYPLAFLEGNQYFFLSVSFFLEGNQYFFYPLAFLGRESIFFVYAGGVEFVSAHANDRYVFLYALLIDSFLIFIY
jgi:hypothetical protein